MIKADELDQLAGMKHIRYKDQERDEAWKFMCRISDELLEENRKLREENSDLRNKKGDISVASDSEPVGTVIYKW